MPGAPGTLSTELPASAWTSTTLSAPTPKYSTTSAGPKRLSSREPATPAWPEAGLPVEGAILLDSGTTTARIAEMLPLDCELTVVTNSLPIALTLSVRPNLQVLMTGGRVRSRTLAGVGDWTGNALASIRVDVAFLGANGVSPPPTALPPPTRPRQRPSGP